jgi:hypothetical protein
MFDLNKLSKSLLIASGTYLAGAIAFHYYDDNVPRLGPIRALNLNWKVKSKIESIRSDDVEWIRQRIITPPEINGKISVVTGPLCIGKTTAIKWATNNMRGVLDISNVSHKDSYDDILNKVCREITGLKGTLECNKPSMRRVLDCYRFLTGGRMPLIIIHMDSFDSNNSANSLHSTNQKIDQAVNYLAETYGLNILIDYADNHFPLHAIKAISSFPLCFNALNMSS